MSLVNAILNGYSSSIDASEVKFSLDSQWVHVSIGPNSTKFHCRLVFILTNERLGDGTFIFHLATHCFTSIILTYAVDDLAEHIDTVCRSIEKVMPFTLECPQYGSLQDLLSQLSDDYNRMGIPTESSYRISNSNHTFKICATYPQLLVTPKDISDTTLRHAAKYRAGGRLPILSYLHKSGAAIFRSAQALVGLQRNRSIQDERIIETIRMSSPRRELIVVDARPSKSAMANAINGAGFMIMDNYPGCERVYLGIENIHSVRQSYLKIFDLLTKGILLRTAKIEAGWVKHSETIMEGTNLIIDRIKSGYSVLVHCSDGWDRTAQLVTLAQICLDPYYRSLAGLLVLLQREWISSGHQFDRRLARQASVNVLLDHSITISKVIDKITGANMDDPAGGPQEEFCPVFPQFLDCLLQLMRVYPDAFEFNTQLIHDLWREAYLTETETFKYNCDQDRYLIREINSYWLYIGQNMSKYKNTSYQPVKEILSIGKNVSSYI